jgi:lipoyl-dependent peroxiredoxin
LSIEKVLYTAHANATGGRDGRAVSSRHRINLPAELSVAASVGIGAIPSGFGIEATLKVSVPGMSRADAESLVQHAHLVCPYSNATRGNIDVRLIVV